MNTRRQGRVILHRRRSGRDCRVTSVPWLQTPELLRPVLDNDEPSRVGALLRAALVDLDPEKPSAVCGDVIRTAAMKSGLCVVPTGGDHCARRCEGRVHPGRPRSALPSACRPAPGRRVHGRWAPTAVRVLHSSTPAPAVHCVPERRSRTPALVLPHVPHTRPNVHRARCPR